MSLWPTDRVAPVTNGARLARFALAAYQSIPAEREVLTKEIHNSGGTIYAWQLSNANGITCYNDNTCVIAIAGSGGLCDAITDTDIVKLTVGQIGRDCGLVPGTRRELKLHAGFATHAVLVHRAADPNLLIVPTRDLWITGHSLGAAAAYCLSCFEPFHDARIVGFGGPRCVDRWTEGEPARSHLQFRHLLDPVPSTPAITFRHPKARVYYLRHSHEIPRSSRTIYSWLWFAIYELVSTARYIGTRMGWRKKDATPGNPFKYHSMNLYNVFLTHLR